ncbi:HutD family protein [Thalassospira sp. TSL5-1]|uniref:HutD/Ves family protein n=1 Tax=Thalassospira sp. TSL5-1 TaxID=1544451 RepID=UPI000ABE8DDC|nr:HutD family protein [Thalassospira sp. TSL5-1]
MTAPSAIRILRASDYRRMPWKNGGGETVEIAVYPANAGLDDFAWRISMAKVASDGPFSSFPGIDRTLSILEGAGMTLVIGDQAPVTLTHDTPPYPFAADIPTSAMLVDGPITDLNVMTRRNRSTHRVTRHVVNGTQILTTSEKTVTFILVQDAVEIVVGDGETHQLQPLDAMICDPSAADFTLKTDKSTTVYEIVLTA